MSRSVVSAGDRPAVVAPDTEFQRGLGLYASTMFKAGSMGGSGIFIVPVEIRRQTGSPGSLLRRG